MKGRLKQALQSLRLGSISRSSRIFVSVSVVKAMPSSRLSRQSTKIIIKVSIWTCLVLTFLFLATYTALLFFVDKQFHPAEFDIPYKKIRLLGKMRSKDRYSLLRSYLEDDLLGELNPSHRQVVWNASAFNPSIELLPVCRPQTLITILITSSPDHEANRMAIRNTWCNPGLFGAAKNSWRCIFLVGMSDSQDVSQQVEKEMAFHHDILAGSYLDSYRNLTLKVLHGFHWSKHLCPSSYIIKTDDDCFVNIGLFYEFLVRYNEQKEGLYAGNVIADKAKLKVIRGVGKHWSVGYKEYPQVYYPPYASGVGYILSIDTVRQVVAESCYVMPIPNEDAYVGILISHLMITPLSSNRFVLSSSGLTDCNFLYVFIVHHVQPEVQIDLLQRALLSKSTCNHSAITTWS